MISRRNLLMAFTAMLVTQRIAGATAQGAYPIQPIHVIVPNPPGGPGDLITRVIADKAASFLGQPLVLEYKAGASTVIGTEFVSRAKPDGYTILSLPSSGLLVSVLRQRLPYSLERDFKPIIGLGSIPMAIAVAMTSKFKTIADLAAAARSQGITYSSAGPGTLAHLAAVRLLNDLKGTGTHVPYQGNPEALEAVAKGDVDLFFPSIAESRGLVGAGTIRLLGVTSEHRIPDLPDVPTTAELGMPDFNPKLWYAFLAPAAVPSAAITRLYDVCAEALKDPSVQSRLGALGFVVEPRDPAAIAKFMDEEAIRWRKVATDNKISLDN